MGIVAKQGIFNTINLTTGMLLGAINTIVLIPIIFKGQENLYGAIQLLVSYAIIFSQFLSFGAPNIIVRYFHSFLEKGQLTKLLKYAATLSILGAGLVLFIFSSGKNLFLSVIHASDAETLLPLIGVLVVLSIILIFYSLTVGIAQSMLKPSIPYFLSEVFLRLLLLALFLFYWKEEISFINLIWIYTGGYLFNLMVMLWVIKDVFNWKSTGKKIQQKTDSKSLLKYGLFSIIDKGSSIFINRLDILMIGYFLGIEQVTFYVFGLYIGTVVSVPQRALSSIVNPLIAKAWSENNLLELGKLYRQTTIVQFIFGTLLFLLISTNLSTLLAQINTDYLITFSTAIVIGISKLILQASSIGGVIIFYSHKYIVNFYINLIFLGVAFLTNWIFIPIYGILGAAIATALAIFVFSSVRIGYVYYKWNMTPYNSKIFLVIIVGLVLYITQSYIYIPTGWFLTDIAVNSFLSILIFGTVILKSNVSPELNQFYSKFLLKFRS